MYINLFCFMIISSLIVLFVSQKKNLFLDIKDTMHKRFVTKTEKYSIGGILLFMFFIYFYYYIGELKSLYILFFGLILLVGFFSDLKFLENPKKRFFIQILILFIFIYLIDLRIPLTKIHTLDFFLNNFYFNKFFTIFCLMIFINGSNFIDGINTLLIGYNILICSALLLFFDTMLQDKLIVQCFLIALLVLLFFNSFGKIILGDSGSYLLSFFIGIYLINFSSSTNAISPFLIILLLWYPCFELLFSMIRRVISNKKMYEPDIHHFHQILFRYFDKKIKNENLKHIAVSLLINGYAFLMLFLIVNINQQLRVSHILIAIITNIIIYLMTYVILINFIKKN